MTEKEILIKEIVGAIRKLYRAVYLESAKMKNAFGMTGPQSGALRTVALDGPLSSAALSRKLFVTPSNMTGIIDRLESKGLVERIKQPGDRRVTLIAATRKGKAMAEALPDPIETKLIAVLADLNPDQVRNLLHAMNKILCLADVENQ